MLLKLVKLQKQPRVMSHKIIDFNKFNTGFRSKDESGYLRVSEFFFDTIQGEGVYTGTPAAFLRLQGCTLRCSYCDSIKVWKTGEGYSIEWLIDEIINSGLAAKLHEGHHLVITGGSPLLQQDQLLIFLQRLVDFLGFMPFIEIENECVILPSNKLRYYISCWNNSPKLDNSGNLFEKAYKPAIIHLTSTLENSWFKFVIENEQDWDTIVKWFLDPHLIRKGQIILMPQGQTREEILKNQTKVIEIAIKNSVKFSNRMHVILWDLTTGV